MNTKEMRNVTLVLWAIMALGITMALISIFALTLNI